MTVAFTLLCLAAWAGPAIAADQTVHAVGAVNGDYGTVPDHFAPANVMISPGESVTFVNDAGQHNVHFDDGQFTSPLVPSLPSAWPSPPAKRTFTQAGTYRFICDLHGASGMVGTVQVGTAGTNPGTGTGTNPGTGTGTGTGQLGSPTTSPGGVAIVSLSTVGRRFCNGGSRCRRPGVRLRINLSKAAPVTGTLSRRPLTGSRRARAFGTVRFGTVQAGSRQLKFRRTSSGRKLVSGRYTLKVRVGDLVRTLKFSVVS